MNRRDFFKRFGAGAAAVGVGVVAAGKDEKPKEEPEPAEFPKIVTAGTAAAPLDDRLYISTSNGSIQYRLCSSGF